MEYLTGYILALKPKLEILYFASPETAEKAVPTSPEER